MSSARRFAPALLALSLTVGLTACNQEGAASSTGGATPAPAAPTAGAPATGNPKAENPTAESPKADGLRSDEQGLPDEGQVARDGAGNLNDLSSRRSGRTTSARPSWTGRAELRPSADAALTLTQIRTGRHAEYDRVVYQFSGNGQPGFVTNLLQSDPVEEPTGRTLHFDGGGTIEVLLRGTVTPPAAGAVRPGSRRYPGLTPREVWTGGTHHGQQQSVVVSEYARPYRAFTLSDPPRVVVDVAH